MAKKNRTEVENLFDNSSFTSFEVEGEEKKTDSIEESNNGFEIEVTNKQELKEILDEWSIPEELYNIATHKPFGFLHVSYCAGGQPIYFSKFSRITFDEK